MLKPFLRLKLAARRPEFWIGQADSRITEVMLDL